ncbi:abc transporter g family member 10 [Citrus sinensis]|uniref:Abc transporter g family member 10 n=1 Tax=Citrus sinensis TaxID=2711 RepID=A0ACB8N1P3_CITSI|nr:abc transporter g family member 10 [Citrus sinensis]
MIPQNRVSGSVLANERTVNAQQFRRLSGYVSQDNEVLLPLLTVEETLMYSARLRLHGGFNMAKARVIELMHELELDYSFSIGVDLIHDPSVLLVDEPTSGLDSASALNVALLLKSVAVSQGKTIVLTIHQAGYQILELFGQTLLLLKGTVLHRGSLNLLEHRLRFAGQVISQHVNVMDYCTAPIMEVIILIQRFSKNIFRTKQLFAARIFLSALADFLSEFHLISSHIKYSCFPSSLPNCGSSICRSSMTYFKYWIFMHYLSLFKYPFEYFIINEYGGEKSKRKCLKAIEGQGLKDSQKWSNLSLMLGFVFGYRFLCFFILWYRSYRSQC